MTKSEHSQLKLKSKATSGIEKFGLEPNTPVEYEVTLVTFEKVCIQLDMIVKEKKANSRVLIDFIFRRKNLGQ